MSSPGRPLVIQTEDLDEAAGSWLAERCDVVVCGVDDPGFAAQLARADALLVRTYTRVDRALLSRAGRLRCVARAGVGLDNIDLDACRAHGVRVVHTPDANSDAVAEYVLALMLDATRPRLTLSRAIDAGAWKRARRECVAPNQLNELTLGILGLGRIGSRVARICRAGLGMRVLYHDLMDIEPARRSGAVPVPLEHMLAQSDIVTLHIDPREGNRRFINAQRLALCKPTLVLINACRGMVVDDLALAAFLRDHPRAMALLDVHEPEPFDADYPLLGLKNAHLAPHLAACTATGQSNMSWVVRDVWRVLQGEEPEFPAR